MSIVVHTEYSLGDLIARYIRERGDPRRIGLVLIPASLRRETRAPRELLQGPWIDALPAQWLPLRATEVDPLVHVHVRGDALAGGFAAGRSMRSSASTDQLRFHRQRVTRRSGVTSITTELRDDRGLRCLHILRHQRGEKLVRCRTRVLNASRTALTLELLTSFSLGGITPFADHDAAERLRLHRLRSAWSAEGRHDVQTLEQLQLERSWSGYGIAAERFGQVGSMPVNGWFPLVALEDTEARVTWAAQIAHAASWQLEVWRRKDQVALSGGLADRELGHWWKTLSPGDDFTSPEALLTCAVGDFNAACDRLRTAVPAPKATTKGRAMPIVFNEWCTSWGNPTHDNLLRLADRLRGLGVDYLVIDDGWAKRPGPGFQQNGDWEVEPRSFPRGIAATSRALRARGLIPGIWFEFEVANAGSKAWTRHTRHFLHRDGQPLQVGARRFWDFRDPWVRRYLRRKVIHALRKWGIGYLKVDYNDSIGIGADGAESPGEALRAHLAAVQEFFAELRLAVPELVIENCSSGAHRAEPSMLALTDVSSFSDAHETPDIPVIAANLLRVLPAHASLIWAVVRRTDSLPRLSYSLAACFLGRLCLSGEVHDLKEPQWDFLRRACVLYRQVSPSIQRAVFRRVVAPSNQSWQKLKGAQVVLGHDQKTRRLLVVWHTFARPPRTLHVPLPAGNWIVIEELAHTAISVVAKASYLHLPGLNPWQGGVLLLEDSSRHKD